MGTAKSPLESQPGQDRSGNTQVQGQLGMPPTTLFNLFLRAAPALPCGRQCIPCWAVSRDIPSSTRQQSFHTLGPAVSLGSAEPPAPPAPRDSGSGCASPASAPCGDSHPQSHPNTCFSLCRTPRLGCYRVENLEILYFLFICHGPSYAAERTGTSGHPRSAFVALSSSEPQYCFASCKRCFKIPLRNPLPQS